MSELKKGQKVWIAADARSPRGDLGDLERRNLRSLPVEVVGTDAIGYGDDVVWVSDEIGHVLAYASDLRVPEDFKIGDRVRVASRPQSFTCGPVSWVDGVDEAEVVTVRSGGDLWLRRYDGGIVRDEQGVGLPWLTKIEDDGEAELKVGQTVRIAEGATYDHGRCVVDEPEWGEFFAGKVGVIGEGPDEDGDYLVVLDDDDVYVDAASLTVVEEDETPVEEDPIRGYVDEVQRYVTNVQRSIEDRYNISGNRFYPWPQSRRAEECGSSGCCGEKSEDNEGEDFYEVEPVKPVVNRKHLLSAFGKSQTKHGNPSDLIDLENMLADFLGHLDVEVTAP